MNTSVLPYNKAHGSKIITSSQGMYTDYYLINKLKVMVSSHIINGEKVYQFQVTKGLLIMSSMRRRSEVAKSACNLVCLTIVNIKIITYTKRA